MKDANDIEKDYEHFGPPFILEAERIFTKIRNLKYRHFADETLFPTEIQQYDPWIIREALHNCIAHQDYDLNGKINVVEKEDELIFSNVGTFIPGNVETVIMEDSPPEIYRNRFLADAMVNLNMIETIGGGIKKMFEMQMRRFFPLPDYDLTQSEKVTVKIKGRIVDEIYVQLLMRDKDLDLPTVMLLDKVQKHVKLSKDEHRFLKLKKLVEGRYPNLFLSSHIAAATGEKTDYIKYRGFKELHYKRMIIDFIKEYDFATRADINRLLLDSLSKALGEEQKLNKIKNLLAAMSKKDKTIKNIGSRTRPKWVLSE